MLRLRTIFFIAIFIIIGLSAPVAIGQKNNSHTLFNQTYDNAYDLFSKQKYGSAISIFDKVAFENENPFSSISEYYAAICAARLTHQDAKSRFETYLNKYPNSANTNTAWFEYGKVFLEENKFISALSCFRKVNKIDLEIDDQKEFVFKQGYAMFKSNKLDDAKNNFVLLLHQKSPYQTPATYYYAYIHYLKKDFEYALTYFQQIENDKSFSAVTKYYLVQIYSQTGRYNELIPRALDLINNSNDVKNIEMIRLLADAYYKTEQYNEALNYYSKLQEFKSVNLTQLENYQTGKCLVLKSKHNDAIQYFQNATKGTDSLSQYAYMQLGECYLTTGQKRFAHSSFNSSYKLDKDKELAEEALFNYAKLSIDLSYNPYNEAILALQDYIKMYPNSKKTDEAYSYLTSLYLLTKNYKNAFISIKQIKKLTPELEDINRQLALYYGIELFNSQKYKHANSLFKVASEKHYRNQLRPEALFWSAETYYRLYNWDSAIIVYDQFFKTPGANKYKHFNLANYNESYANFNKKNYPKAIIGFKKYIQNSDNEIKFKPDAHLRLADCYFMNREYNQAIQNYSQALEFKIPDSDYAMFQMGVCYGVTGNMQKKIEILNNLLSTYSRSNYTDDALYEIGLTYNILSNDSEALSYYQKVVREHPNSVFVKKSLLKTGLIKFNNGQNQEALDVLKTVATRYAGTPEAQEALNSIKSIYVEMNKIDDYIAFSKDNPAAKITTSEQDSLTYIAAERLYMDGNCEKASDAFNNYIKRFHEGIYSPNVRYFLADCQLKTDNIDGALGNYNAILQMPRSRYTAVSALRAARIYQQRDNFEKALEKYIYLEETADNSNLFNDAYFGQLFCNYRLEKHGLAMQAGQKFLKSSNIQDNQKVEAHLIMGKSALNLGSVPQAKSEFEQTVKLSNGEPAAEASFYLANILFENDKFDECEKALMKLTRDYASYDFWVAKSFILLADVYVKKNNIFQAKQTLQSIIDNYEGQDIVNIAKDKLELISNK